MKRETDSIYYTYITGVGVDTSQHCEDHFRTSSQIWYGSRAILVDIPQLGNYSKIIRHCNTILKQGCL